MRARLFVILAVSVFVCPLIFAQSPEDLSQAWHWRMIGPFRGGRTRAVAGVPSQPSVFYMGAVDGGVWKSDDYGRTWNPIFDDQPTQSIGAIAVAPSNPDIVYVACGEGLQRPDLSVGDGIYKSTDAGKTWKHLGLRDGQQIPALAIDPRNPDKLFAAVLGHPYGPNPERGIFRSIDGGATWEKVLFKDDNTGGSDVEIDPSNPDLVYASLWQSRLGPWEDNNGFAGTNGGLFKSTDGGTTWRKLTDGLPDNLVQINVAVAPSQTSRLYATLSTTTPTAYATDKGLGFFRSDDGGESWTRITDDPRPAMKIGGGDLPIARVDPKNPDIVYSASLVTVRSTDGGKTWESIRGAPGGDDYQNLWINPEHPEIILLVADQGALVTTNGGKTWSSWYNQPTAQLYHVITTNEFPYKVCGGQQESGSVCISSRGNDGEITFRDWHPVGVIEYGYVAPDPLDHDIVYGAGRSEVSRFHWSTGQVENITPIPNGISAPGRKKAAESKPENEAAQTAAEKKEKSEEQKYRIDRTEPIVFSPADPHTLYYAANVVFRTADGGHSWQKISPDLTREHPEVPSSVGDQLKLNQKAGKQRGAIYALAPSFHDPKTLWAGTDDGLVWITRDGGTNWTDITPPQLTVWSKITQISASHFDEQTAYVSVSRFRIDDLRPYIYRTHDGGKTWQQVTNYRTHDGGKTWQQVTNGLPDNAPANTVREDPTRKGLLFAGTESGVWLSFDDGNNWKSLQLNLPHTSVRDLTVHDNDLIVATHGRSFWILDDIAALRQMSSTAESVRLFTPAPAYRARRDTNTDTPLPGDEPAGENPPDGLPIDYFLPQSSSGPVALEILDAQGKLVRRYSSDDKPVLNQTDLQKEMIPLYWLRPQKTLSVEAGMHRWVWDLRYPQPTSTLHEYPIAAVPHDTPRYPLGPLALPGKYSVRLIANGVTQSSGFELKMDPRVKTTSESLKQKFDLEMRLASAITRSSEAVSQARSVQEQVANAAKKSTPVSEAANRLAKRLAALLEGEENDSGASTLKSANNDSIDLYKEVEKSDAAPTLAQINAANHLEPELAGTLKTWEQIKTKDLPALNLQLPVAGLPQIRLDLAPIEQETGENEE